MVEISKRYSSYSFHPVSAKLYEDIGYHGGIQAIAFLGNWPSFEILTWESMQKTKIWNISKTADRRAKRLKIGDSGYYTVHIWRLLLMPGSLTLVWGHSVHFAKFPILQFIKLFSSPNFRRIHPNFIQSILIIQTITVWRYAKN